MQGTLLKLAFLPFTTTPLRRHVNEFHFMKQLFERNWNVNQLKTTEETKRIKCRGSTERTNMRNKNDQQQKRMPPKSNGIPVSIIYLLICSRQLCIAKYQ